MPGMNLLAACHNLFNTAIQVIYHFHIIGKNVSEHKYFTLPPPPSPASYYLQGFDDIFFFTPTRTFSQVNDIVRHQEQESDFTAERKKK